MANQPSHHTVWKLYGYSSCYIKKERHWAGVSVPVGKVFSIPGMAPELWTSAYTTSGLGRSLGAWASALSLYRLIPGQSSEAAAWAVISWKPIKCSWAYFGSGMERGSHSQNSWAPCWFNCKGPLSPRVSPWPQASLLFLTFCKKQRQMRRGKTLFRYSLSFFYSCLIARDFVSHADLSQR